MMGDRDHELRKCALKDRMKKNLKKKREAFADQFDFRMYITFHFKDEKKKSAIYEVDEVKALMTSDQSLATLQAARKKSYPYAEHKDLMSKDIVQCYSHLWRPMRKDLVGCKCKTVVEYFLWPRNDIDRVTCHLFSKWKEEEEPYRHLNATFTIHSREYERFIQRLLEDPEKTSLTAANQPESFFLIGDKLTLQTSQNRRTIIKLKAACAYIPQDQLMNWTSATVEDVLAQQAMG